MNRLCFVVWNCVYSQLVLFEVGGGVSAHLPDESSVGLVDSTVADGDNAEHDEAGAGEGGCRDVQVVEVIEGGARRADRRAAVHRGVLQGVGQGHARVPKL